MTEFQRLFLVQARSDFVVFKVLQKHPELPPCHALHYLQMATEMLGKAHVWKQGPPANSHRAFVGFLRSLSSNRRAQRELDFAGQNENWKHSIRKSVPFAERIEDLAAALSPDAPNPECPWPRHAPQTTPAEHDFDIWEALQKTTVGRRFLSLLNRLFAVADSYL